MPYKQWHQKVIDKTKPRSEIELYIRAGIFGVFSFGLFYLYARVSGLSNPLNKAVADASIFLIGCSMLLSSLCYFWDFVDTKIVYRKHLGLVGFAFGLAHIWLTFGLFRRLFTPQGWEKGIPWAPLTGLFATVILTVMALVSNKYAAKQLGGKNWRAILRLGYVAMVFVVAHIIVLKWKHWLSWIETGPYYLPASSLLLSGFVFMVIAMRIALWWSLSRKKQ